MQKFKEWLLTESIWYHGSRKDWNDIQGKSFGGIHLGTKKAAIERLENTPSGRIRGVPGHEKVYTVDVKLKEPYNTPDDPMSEHDLFLLLNPPGPELMEIRKKHDGIYYRNIAEDRGSISVLVFDKDRLNLLGVEEMSL